MKYIKLSLLLFLGTAFFGACTTSKAQESANVDISNLIESRNFTFKAETAMPIRGGNRQLTGAYDVAITNSSINGDLPFFGRAQTISPGNADGGIRFRSTDFNYNAVRNKKGWGITIRLNDVGHVRQLYLSIFDNGTATLDVMNIHRDDISFRGHIK